MAYAELVDFANARPSGKALHAAGKKGVIRYLSPDTTNNPGKRLTAAEVADYTAAGLSITLVWETTTNRATQGYTAGVADAHAAEAVREARKLSVRPIYFVAQDQGDITGPACAPYFQGVASVIGLARVGAYGGYAVIKYLFSKHLISYGWQTYAWSGGKWDPRAQLQQYRNGATVAGASVDLTRAMVADWGQGEDAATSEGELSMSDISEIKAELDAIKAALAAVPHTTWNFDPGTAGGGVAVPAWRPDAAGNVTARPAWFLAYIADMLYQIGTAVGIDLAALPAVTRDGGLLAAVAALGTGDGGGLSAEAVKEIVESAKVTVP